MISCFLDLPFAKMYNRSKLDTLPDDQGPEVENIQIEWVATMNSRAEEIKTRLAEIENERVLLLKELDSLSTDDSLPPALLGTPACEKPPGSLVERVVLFLRLFRCRDDVFPKLWESKKKGTAGYSPACDAEWIRGVCGKPYMKCKECTNRAFTPLDESVVLNHLQGAITIGTYTIREDDTCVFIAADFDKEGWDADALAYRAAARHLGVEVCIERSRSGKGGHAWIFFSEPVVSRLARQLGTLILTHAMAQRHHIGFDSYDRFFPSQDTMPKGGFGNLIALPLQKIPARDGNSLFVDDSLMPHTDQWSYLSGVRLLSGTDVASILQTRPGSPKLKETMEHTEDPDLLDAEVSIHGGEEKVRGSHPGVIQFCNSRHLEISLQGLPSPLITAFRRTATFANPKFFELQRMRFSTWNTPRYICSAELSADGDRMMLPRGLLHRCIEIGELAGSRVQTTDLRRSMEPIPVAFTGKLMPPQETALRDMMCQDSGVLVAPPGAGKTVIACAAIAQRKLPTLILVHRKQLADQWRKQLLEFTDLTKDLIGVFGPDERQRSGLVDIAMLQTLARDHDLENPLRGYGHIIVDECHHVPALSFESVLKNIEARHFLGLTATPYRKDGLEKIITMQCGPTLHTMDETKAQSLIERRVIVRETEFRMVGENPQPALHEIWQALVSDKGRLRLVAADVVSVLNEGRFPLILSDRKDHLESLLAEITSIVSEEDKPGFLMTSETGKRMRTRMMEDIKGALERGEHPFLLSTGSLIGEGFDLPELSALILAMPLSFKGRLVQYAGRLHRESSGKEDVVIYDYVDSQVALGITMFRKRVATYRKMGYQIEIPPDSRVSGLFSRKKWGKA